MVRQACWDRCLVWFWCFWRFVSRFAVVARICGALWRQLPAVSLFGCVVRVHTSQCVFASRFQQCEQSESSSSLQCSSEAVSR